MIHCSRLWSVSMRAMGASTQRRATLRMVSAVTGRRTSAESAQRV